MIGANKKEKKMRRNCMININKINREQLVWHLTRHHTYKKLCHLLCASVKTRITSILYFVTWGIEKKNTKTTAISIFFDAFVCDCCERCVVWQFNSTVLQFAICSSAHGKPNGVIVIKDEPDLHPDRLTMPAEKLIAMIFLLMFSTCST